MGSRDITATVGLVVILVLFAVAVGTEAWEWVKGWPG